MITRDVVLLIMLVSLVSCVEEFQPQLDESDQLLVVDGKITNLEGPYTIKLSRSSGLDIHAIEPVAGASVIISEENGPSVSLTEIEPGTYQTEADGLQGEVGKSYKLALNIGGIQYETDYELLKKPTAINSVDARFEYQASYETPEDVPGLQFYVNTDNSTFKEDYFLWTLEGTYKYHASLLIYYVYDGSFREFDNHDTLNTCYRTYDIRGVYTASTSNLSAPQVLDKPLYFLPATDIRLSVRYSLFTSQYSISKDAYQFWHQVELQSNGGESLYTTQPYQIRGNVKNINNPDEPILGYFTVAGVTQNRIFMDQPPEVDIVLEDCVPDPMALIAVFDSKPEDWPIYLPKGGMVNEECVDCQLLGGKLEKPSFWLD